MTSPARPAGSIFMQATLRAAPVSALVIAAMAVGFLWSSGHDDQRCAELVLLALLVPFMLARAGTAGQIAWMGRPGICCLAGFFALGAVSSLRASSLPHALYEWSILLLLLLAAALLAAELARAGNQGIQTLLRGVVIVGILYALRMALMYAAILASGVQSSFTALAVGFSNERFFNHAQTALLPLVVLSCLQAPKGSRWRQAAFGLAAVWWSYLFLSEARASILGLAAGCMLVFLVRRAQARSFLKAMALSALAGVVVYVLVFVLLPVLLGLQPFGTAMNVVERTAANPTSDRTLMWRLCIELIAGQPWLGVGPQHFAHQPAALHWGAHPHDFLLQIGAEWGLPALLCLLAAIGLGMRGLLRSAGRIAQADLPGQQMPTVLLAAGTAILVDGLFSGVLVMPQSQLAIVLYLACAAGWMRSQDQRPAPQSGAASRWLSSGLAVLALCALAYGVAPGIDRHARHAPPTPAEQRLNASVQWPRLWEAGHF